MAKTKFAIFKGGTSPLSQGLPTNVAASIGRIVARHSQLDAILASIIYGLLGISIKQGRIAIRTPQTGSFATVVKDLLQFHGVYRSSSMRQFTLALQAADMARNLLAHSLFLRDKVTKELSIQIVKGSWEFDEEEVVSVNRALNPQPKVVDRAFLAQQRAAVENGIKAATNLQREIRAVLAALNERRRTQPALDRRRPESRNIHPAPPQSSPA